MCLNYIWIFDWFYREDILAKFSRTLLWLFQYCMSYWPFRGICCVGGVLVSLWLTVLVWGRMCFSTQHNIFLKWMCTYDWCCLIFARFAAVFLLSFRCMRIVDYVYYVYHPCQHGQSVITIYVDVVLCGHCWCTVTTALWSPQRWNFSQKFNLIFLIEKNKTKNSFLCYVTNIYHLS